MLHKLNTQGATVKKLKTIGPGSIYGFEFSFYHLLFNFLTFLSLSFLMFTMYHSLPFEPSLTSGLALSDRKWWKRDLAAYEAEPEEDVELLFVPSWSAALRLPCEEAGPTNWKVRDHMKENGNASGAPPPITRHRKEYLEPSRTASPSDTWNTRMNPGETSGKSLSHPT